jgi:hypothetical protein
LGHWDGIVDEKDMMRSLDKFLVVHHFKLLRSAGEVLLAILFVFGKKVGGCLCYSLSREGNGRRFSFGVEHH